MLEFRCLGTHKRSHLDIKGGQRPEWDSEVRFSVHRSAAVKHRKLEVACYSQEPRTEDLMGKGELDITETLRTGEFDGELLFQPNESQSSISKRTRITRLGTARSRWRSTWGDLSGNDLLRQRSCAAQQSFTQ